MDEASVLADGLSSDSWSTVPSDEEEKQPDENTSKTSSWISQDIEQGFIKIWKREDDDSWQKMTSLADCRRSNNKNKNKRAAAPSAAPVPSERDHRPKASKNAEKDSDNKKSLSLSGSFNGGKNTTEINKELQKSKDAEFSGLKKGFLMQKTSLQSEYKITADSKNGQPKDSLTDVSEKKPVLSRSHSESHKGNEEICTQKRDAVKCLDQKAEQQLLLSNSNQKVHQKRDRKSLVKEEEEKEAEGLQDSAILVDDSQEKKSNQINNNSMGNQIDSGFSEESKREDMDIAIERKSVRVRDPYYAKERIAATHGQRIDQLTRDNPACSDEDVFRMLQKSEQENIHPSSPSVKIEDDKTAALNSEHAKIDVNIEEKEDEPLYFCCYQACAEKKIGQNEIIYYEMICQNDCNLRFHSACFIRVKEEHGMQNKRRMKKAECITPDCHALILLINMYKLESGMRIQQLVLRCSEPTNRPRDPSAEKKDNNNKMTKLSKKATKSVIRENQAKHRSPSISALHQSRDRSLFANFLPPTLSNTTSTSTAVTTTTGTVVDTDQIEDKNAVPIADANEVRNCEEDEEMTASAESTLRPRTPSPDRIAIPLDRSDEQQEDTNVPHKKKKKRNREKIAPPTIDLDLRMHSRSHFTQSYDPENVDDEDEWGCCIGAAGYSTMDDRYGYDARGNPEVPEAVWQYHPDYSNRTPLGLNPDAQPFQMPPQSNAKTLPSIEAPVTSLPSQPPVYDDRRAVQSSLDSYLQRMIYSILKNSKFHKALRQTASNLRQMGPDIQLSLDEFGNALTANVHEYASDNSPDSKQLISELRELINGDYLERVVLECNQLFSLDSTSQMVSAADILVKQQQKSMTSSEGDASAGRGPRSTSTSAADIRDDQESGIGDEEEETACAVGGNYENLKFPRKLTKPLSLEEVIFKQRVQPTIEQALITVQKVVDEENVSNDETDQADTSPVDKETTDHKIEAERDKVAQMSSQLKVERARHKQSSEEYQDKIAQLETRVVKTEKSQKKRLNALETELAELKIANQKLQTECDQLREDKRALELVENEHMRAWRSRALQAEQSLLNRFDDDVKLNIGRKLADAQTNLGHSKTILDSLKKQNAPEAAIQEWSDYTTKWEEIHRLCTGDLRKHQDAINVQQRHLETGNVGIPMEIPLIQFQTPAMPEMPNLPAKVITPERNDKHDVTNDQKKQPLSTEQTASNTAKTRVAASEPSEPLEPKVLPPNTATSVRSVSENPANLDSQLLSTAFSNSTPIITKQFADDLEKELASAESPSDIVKPQEPASSSSSKIEPASSSSYHNENNKISTFSASRYFFVNEDPAQPWTSAQQNQFLDYLNGKIADHCNRQFSNDEEVLVFDDIFPASRGAVGCIPENQFSLDWIKAIAESKPDVWIGCKLRLVDESGVDGREKPPTPISSVPKQLATSEAATEKRAESPLSHTSSTEAKVDSSSSLSGNKQSNRDKLLAQLLEVARRRFPDTTGSDVYDATAYLKKNGKLPKEYVPLRDAVMNHLAELNAKAEQAEKQQKQEQENQEVQKRKQALENECPICLIEIINENQAQKTSISCALCRYKFHITCLAEWLNKATKRVCPQCQRSFIPKYN